MTNILKFRGVETTNQICFIPDGIMGMWGFTMVRLWKDRLTWQSDNDNAGYQWLKPNQMVLIGISIQDPESLLWISIDNMQYVNMSICNFIYTYLHTYIFTYTYVFTCWYFLLQFIPSRIPIYVKWLPMWPGPSCGSGRFELCFFGHSIPLGRLSRSWPAKITLFHR